MKKKIILLLLVIASVFALAACSGDSNKEKSTPSPSTKADISIEVNEGEEVDWDEILGLAPQKKVEYVDLEITEQCITQESIDNDWNFYVNQYKVKNIGSTQIKWITLQFNYLDANGDIVDAPLYSDGSADGVIVQPSQSITIKGNISKDKNIKTVILTSARYYVQDPENPDKTIEIIGKVKNVQPLTLP